MTDKNIEGTPLTILVVEDEPGHVELIMRCFKKYQVANQIQHVPNGEAALNYLFRLEDYADPAKSPRPHMILLDLRLPKIDGLEVLEKIKNSTELRMIPVVVLTTSEAEKDINRAYEKYANSYLVKPIDFEKFTKLMDDLGFYWLGWNKYPWS